MKNLKQMNNMRKRYKNKKSSCALCKPHKRGWEKRYDERHLEKLKDSEKTILDAKTNA